MTIAGAGLASSLGGCSAFSTGSITDYFKSTPPAIQVQIESTPPGAEAKTSLGPSCKTPCSVSVSPPDNTFTVTYALNKFQQATVPVTVIRNPGDVTAPATTTIDPNPVFSTGSAHQGYQAEVGKEKEAGNGAGYGGFALPRTRRPASRNEPLTAFASAAGPGLSTLWRVAIMLTL